MIQRRNIVTCIILSLVTCGIYGLIWFYQMTNDAALANDNRELDGFKAIIFTIITCGIYSFYWNYKMGKEIYEAKTKRNLNANDNSILYLVLSLFGMAIVNYCLIQSDLNEISDNQ